MKPLKKFLSTKSQWHKPKGMDVIVNSVKEIFGVDLNESKTLIQAIENEFNSKDYNNGFRIYSNDTHIIEYLENTAWIKDYVFMNLLEENIVDDIVDDVIENEDTETFEDSDLVVLIGDDYPFIAIVNDNEGSGAIVFEKLEKEETVNPRVDTYYAENHRWLELSDRKLMLEIKKYPKNEERFYDVLNDLISDSISNFEAEHSVNLSIFGRGGRHVCVAPEFRYIHKYKELIELVDKEQDNLLLDFDDEAQYQIDNEEENEY